jgi:hypothetical protein
MFVLRHRTTGSASGRSAAAPLHPRLQSAAPLGRKTAGPPPECIGSGRSRYVYFRGTYRIVTDGSVARHRGAPPCGKTNFLGVAKQNVIL